MRGYEGNFGKHGGTQHTRFEATIVGSSPTNEANLWGAAEGCGGGFLNEAHQQKCSSAGGLANGSKTAWERHRPKMTLAVSNELKRRHQLGMTSFLGKRHTDETKNKMRASHQGLQQGEKNSQFGTCWVTNGLPIKIKKEQLDEYLKLGYSRGRKLIY